MEMVPVPALAGLGDYERQARELLEAWRAGDPVSVRLVKTRHPRFLSDRIPWLPRPISDADALASPFDLDDARLGVARWYDFASWARLVEHVDSVADEGSMTATFELAVDLVISGEAASLAAFLSRHADLVRWRSARVTHFDPPVHRATLLHYVAANGVEGYRQKSPANAAEIAATLLHGGAEVDALANMYGGQCTTMSMLVSSTPPAVAGVQVALVNTLLDFGADVDGAGSGAWTSPLMTALVFGFQDAAETLVRRGARVDSLAAWAGLGRAAEVRELLPIAGAADRHRALALAAQLGHTDVVALLLNDGEDPDRYNPGGMHSHSTPLHQAVWAGHEAVVRLLVERGARLDLHDSIYEATPLGWAEYGGRTSIAEYLRQQGG
jgi:ankyrin repeat protein